MHNKPPRLSRRTLLGTAIALTALAGVTSGRGGIPGVAGRPSGCAHPKRSPRRWPCRPPKRGASAPTREFSLSAQQRGSSDFGATQPTPTWGFNGAYLGPTLRARQGERVRVIVAKLRETTTVHRHGMHLLAKYDGGPHQPIERGQTGAPTWQIKQEPATLW